MSFFFTTTPTTDIYPYRHTLSPPDALPISGAVRPAGAADNSGAARHATRAGRRAGPHLATAPHAHAVLNARLGLWPAHHPPCGRLRRWLPSDRLAHGLTPLFCPRGPFLANRARRRDKIGRAHV